MLGTIAPDLKLLSGWEWYSEIGTLCVILGVAGEGVEILLKAFKRKSTRLGEWYEIHETLIDFVGTVFWVLVVLGLAMEMRGGHKAVAMKSDWIVGLTAIATTNELAAAQANERASSNELEVAALRLKLQPRTITKRQREIFMATLTNVPKCSVSIHLGNSDNETKNYAEEIKSLLTDVGYKVPSVVYDLGNSVRTHQFTGIMMISGITNLTQMSDFPAFFGLQNAFQAIQIDVRAAPIPLATAVPKEFSTPFNSDGWKSNVLYPLINGNPTEVIITVHEKAF